MRLYLGYEWISAGVSKIGSPAWTGDDAGAALTGFVNGALQKTAGEHPDVQGWYAWALRNVDRMKLVPSMAPERIEEGC